MIKKEQAEASKGSQDTMKPWFDFMFTWNHPALEGVRGFYNPSGNGDKHVIGWWNIPIDWEKTGENWNRVLKGVSVKTGEMDEVSEAFLKHMAALHKYQDEWADSWIQLFRTAYEIGVESGMDDDINVDHFLNTLNSAGARIERALEDYLKDSPFSEFAPVLPAVKKSIEAFSEEKKVATAVWKEWITTQRKIAKLCKTAVADRNLFQEGQNQYDTFIREIIRNSEISDGMSEWMTAMAEFTKSCQAFSMHYLMPTRLPVSQPKQTEASEKKPYAAKTPRMKNLDQIPADTNNAGSFLQSNV